MASLLSPNERFLELLAHLQTAVELLVDEVNLLRLAVDDLTTEVQWRNNEQRAFDLVGPAPCDPPFPPLSGIDDAPPAPPGPEPSDQQRLFQ